jgi:signal transduction histidine kinase/DNA-binding LytR/AlgR family response regulator
VKAYISSIRARLGLVVVAGVVPAVMLASLAAAWRETDRRVTAAEAELNTIGEALAATIALPLAQGQATDVIRALRAVGRMPNVRYARVKDTNGAVVAQFGVGVVMGGDHATRSSLKGLGLPELISLEDYAFTLPIISGGVRVGRLDVVADVAWLGAGFWSAIRAAILSAIAAATLGLLVAMPILALVIQPIRILTGAMRRIQKTADFSRVEMPARTYETGVLVSAFNEMLLKIQERDERLARYRAELEGAVRQRTAQLEVARQAAEAANAAKSDFLATMSHEIRTPMHGMLVTAELLQMTALNDQQRRFAELITKSGRSLLAIVNDILDLSKIEAGRMDLEAVPLEPAAIAEDVAQLFAARAQAKDLTLTTRIEAQVPAWILGDPVRLNQILSNLVGNAIKFTPAGGVEIRLSMAPPGAADSGQLRLEVADSGIGIAPENIDRIFDAFVQANGDTARRFGGTGIGLAICRRLAMAMGGTLRVESRLGKGSTFTCSIPVVAVPAPSARTSDAAMPSAPDRALAGLRVLAADDNPVNRTVLEASLARLGVALTSVTNGAEAVAAFEAGGFDLVLMDCGMPVMDGYEAARRMRAFERETGRDPLPIVALTADVVGRGASGWRDAGMSDCLTKPFTLTGISDTLRRWCPPARRGEADAASPAPAVVSAEAVAAEALFDREILDQVLAMDRGGVLAGKLARLFRDQGGKALPALQAAIAAGDMTEVARLAHFVKSMSLSIGASRVARIAARIELSAGAGDHQEHPGEGAAVEAAFAASLAALDAIIGARQMVTPAAAKSA